MLLSTKHLSGDLFGGLTAAIVALALAFGVQSGMGAISGLYGAIAVGFFAALFGGTQTQISGPTRNFTTFFHPFHKLTSDLEMLKKHQSSFKASSDKKNIYEILCL